MCLLGSVKSEKICCNPKHQFERGVKVGGLWNKAKEQYKKDQNFSKMCLNRKH